PCISGVCPNVPETVGGVELRNRKIFMLHRKINLDYFVRCNIWSLSPGAIEPETNRQHESNRPSCREKVIQMVKNIDDVQQIGKDNVDATLKSFGAVSKNAQAIAVELADYGRKVF